jgi:DNA-binding NarL/FixJ family response regulator
LTTFELGSTDPSPPRIRRQSGIDATRALTSAKPRIAVLILTMTDDTDAVFAAVRAGARGNLLKGADRQELLRAFHGIALLADGYTNTAVAGKLIVSPKTVRNHVCKILTKLQVIDRHEAARLAREAGLRDSPT